VRDSGTAVILAAAAAGNELPGRGATGDVEWFSKPTPPVAKTPKGGFEMLDIVKSIPNGNGSAAINGRGLRRRKLTLDQRIDLAADIASGRRLLHPSIKSTAASLKITPAQVSERLKARAQQEAAWRAAEARWRSQAEAEAVNVAADRLVSEWRLSSPEAREAAFRIIGAAEIWDVLVRIVA